MIRPTHPLALAVAIQGCDADHAARMILAEYRRVLEWAFSDFSVNARADFDAMFGFLPNEVDEAHEEP